MKKVITTMLVAAMVLSMAVPTSAATITRKKSTGTTASTTKVSGDYSLKMVDKTLQFIRGGKVVSSIETKDGKITLRKSSAGGISVVFTDANGKRRNITLGKQDSVSLSGTFTQVSVDKALGSSFDVEMEKGSKVTNFYAKGAAKVTLNGSVTTLNVTSSNGNVTANGTVSRAYAVSKKSISGMSAGKITQTSTGTSSNGSVNTATKSSNSSNTTVNSGSGSSGSSSGGSSGIIINGGGSNNGGNSTSKRNPTVSYTASVLPTYDEGTVLTSAMLNQFGLKATYGNSTVAGTFSWTTANTKVMKGTYSYSVTFTPKDTKTYNSVRTSVKIFGKEVEKAQTLAEAKAAIEAALKGVSVTNAVTEAQIQKLADDCITSTDIKAVAKVTVTPATTTAEGTVKGTITLTKGTETATITVDLKIAQLSALQAAKAEVEAALEGIKATKDTTKADVEAVVNPIDTKYTSVDITVGDVTVVEADKTVSVVVSLKEGEATDTVSKTWTYTDGGEEGEAKAPTFTKDPAAPASGSNVTLSKDTPVTLEVAANVDGSTEGITYQWYRSTSNLVDNTAKRVAIDGATSATYTLAPEDEGEFYFFAEAIHTVGNKKASSFSKNVFLKVTVPEGSAVEKPVFTTNLTDGTQTVRLGEQKVLTVAVKTPSAPNTTPKYQWYKSTDSVNPLNGQPMDGETDDTLTVTNNTLGTASYYCVVTNVSTDDVDFNNRTATSKYETITVADTLGMRTVTADTDPTNGGTTAINVTFTKEVTGLTAANFKVEGKEQTKPDGSKVKPTITVGEVESFSDNKSLYVLHVSGIDIDGDAIVTFVAPDGFTISGVNPQEVAIKAPKAPVEVTTVKGFTASKKNAQGETTQLKVTFDKTISSTTPNYVVEMGDPAAPIIINKKTVDPVDNHNVLLDVTLNNNKDDVEATLTTANGTALKPEEKKKVTVERDATAPTVKTASLTANNKEIELLMSEPLKNGQTLSGGDFGIVDTATLPTTVNISDAKFKAGSNNTVIVLTADNPIDITTMTLSYTKTSNFIIDTAASENALADFTGKVIDGAILPNTLAIQEVEVASNKREAVVKMNAPIVVDKGVAPADLNKLFKATDKNDSTKEYAINTVALTAVETKAKALTLDASNNAFKITFVNPLPAGAVVVIAINPDAADVAAKVAIDGKEDAKLPIDQPPVVAPEVKAVSATVADVEVAGKKDVEITSKNVVITLADGTFDDVAAEASGNTWITNLPAGLDASLAAITAGGKTATITISGQPSVALEAPMTIKIPQAAIVDATADLTVATNAKAKFAIVDDTPAGTTATAELANITFAGDKATLPAGTTNDKAGVEAELIKLAQTQVGAGYTVSVDTVYASSYSTSTKVWSGKFVVTNKTESTDKATDTKARNITVIISTTPPSGLNDVTSANAMSAKATDNTVTITLTDGKFKAGTIVADDFTFSGTNKVALEGGNFARTSDTVVTITGVTLAVSTDDKVVVKGATQAAQATGVTMASSKTPVGDQEVTGTVTINGAKTAITTADTVSGLKSGVTVGTLTGLNTSTATVDLVDESGSTVSTLTVGGKVKYKITIAPENGYKIPDNATGINATDYTVAKVGNDLVLTTATAITVEKGTAADTLTVKGVPTTITATDSPDGLKAKLSVEGAGWNVNGATYKWVQNGSEVTGSTAFTASSSEAVTLTVTVPLDDTNFEAPKGTINVTGSNSASVNGTSLEIVYTINS